VADFVQYSWIHNFEGSYCFVAIRFRPSLHHGRCKTVLDPEGPRPLAGRRKSRLWSLQDDDAADHSTLQCLHGPVLHSVATAPAKPSSAQLQPPLSPVFDHPLLPFFSNFHPLRKLLVFLGVGYASPPIAHHKQVTSKLCKSANTLTLALCLPERELSESFDQKMPPPFFARTRAPVANQFQLPMAFRGMPILSLFAAYSFPLPVCEAGTSFRLLSSMAVESLNPLVVSFVLIAEAASDPFADAVPAPPFS